jgi:nickel superoxide dismutase
LVRHHLWVLRTDYFKPPHFEKYPELHQLFNEATKLAGAAGAKQTVDPAKAQELLDKIDEIARVFWETKQGPNPRRPEPHCLSSSRPERGVTAS